MKPWLFHSPNGSKAVFAPPPRGPLAWLSMLLRGYRRHWMGFWWFKENKK